MRLHFVVFHIGLKKPDPFLDMLGWMAASARKFHPDGKVVVLTDEKTEIPAGIADATLVLPGVEPGKMMFHRTLGQCAYMTSGLFTAPTVLIDSDVLVNAPLDSVWREEFDVGLTWRREIPGQPYNGGVVFVRPTPAAVAFWQDVGFRQRLMSEKAQRWWGDQIAMHEAVGVPEKKVGERPHIVTKDGAAVRLFPCDTHNFSPPPDRPPPRRLNGRLLIHFKGDRKAMMADYATRHLGLPDPTPLPEAA